MFGDFGLLEHFRVDLKDFQKLLVEIRKLYLHTNPYHNFRHAFDVTHMVYLLLTNANGTAFLSSIEVFALMLSGLLHDVDHPGLNNTYQIATSSELAIIYNDQSVLENHHCATAFKLLKKHNILKNIAKDDFQRLRKLMIDMILATDLAKHMQNVSAFQSFLESNPTPDRDNDEHRAVIGKMILKSADLCNPAKPFRIARYWAEMIQEEFFLQGEREQVDGLPISPFMKRGASSLPQMQVNFATFIVIPLFQVLGKILPEVEKVVLPILLDNREKWSELLKAELN
uniref:PDEase domain-containing protein n=1 Tax=Arcella intermedia TaxID=1963864 RepID=A0A6B2LAM8_9EUKA